MELVNVNVVYFMLQICFEGAGVVQSVWSLSYGLNDQGSNSQQGQ